MVEKKSRGISSKCIAVNVVGSKNKNKININILFNNNVR